ncbi:uncharacterized protein HaLaN_05452 [Haematococcus lacustris]|uniref:Uncharacterized protein n=1 Tax=Haematococcus lacustris TaxID=44745 RepID=A0A699YJB0_HAELA|nr:uncharacterized protein HaLaN_05452 [Haematococcus lacustris]
MLRQPADSLADELYVTQHVAWPAWVQAPAGRCTVERCKGPFKDCIVFMLGGGNYLEREQLMAWAARNTNASVAAGLGATGTAGRNLLYGTTEVSSGEQFVAQLVELGKRSGVSAATPAGPTQ